MPITAVSSKQALLDLVNADNELSLTLEEVDLGPSELAMTGGDNNASVVIVSSLPDGPEGEVTVNYRRLSETEVFGSKDIELDVPNANATLEEATAATIAHLRSVAKVPMEDGSFTTNGIDAGGTDGFTYFITVDFAAHYVAYGTLTVKVKLPLPQLSDIIVITDLDGFKPEDLQPAT